MLRLSALIARLIRGVLEEAASDDPMALPMIKVPGPGKLVDFCVGLLEATMQHGEQGLLGIAILTLNEAHLELLAELVRAALGPHPPQVSQVAEGMSLESSADGLSLALDAFLAWVLRKELEQPQLQLRRCKPGGCSTEPPFDEDRWSECPEDVLLETLWAAWSLGAAAVREAATWDLVSALLARPAFAVVVRVRLQADLQRQEPGQLSKWSEVNQLAALWCAQKGLPRLAHRATSVTRRLWAALRPGEGDSGEGHESERSSLPRGLLTEEQFKAHFARAFDRELVEAVVHLAAPSFRDQVARATSLRKAVSEDEPPSPRLKGAASPLGQGSNPCFIEIGWLKKFIGNVNWRKCT